MIILLTVFFSFLVERGRTDEKRGRTDGKRGRKLQDLQKTNFAEFQDMVKVRNNA